MKHDARGSANPIRIRVADSDEPGTATFGNGVVLLGVYRKGKDTSYPALLGHFQLALEDMCAKCPRGASFYIKHGEGCAGRPIQWIDFYLCILTFKNNHPDLDITVNK
jgi:hypothetical protein